MNKLLKLAVSSLVAGALVSGNAASGAEMERQAQAQAKAEREAARVAAKAQRELRERELAKAIMLAEQAVALDPDNAEHRALLGQAYLDAGRYASAASAFRDTLTLNPAHGRAALGLALAEIAYGRADSARTVLEQSRQFVPAPDFGLALALAGDKDGAISILEAAARSEHVTPKTRQNLALAYALAGRWKEAHVVAAQDLSGDQLLERMSQWSQFAKPQSASDQVAALLGVKPTIDPGMPRQLALVEPAPAAAAAAAAAEATAAEAVQTALAEPVAPVPEAPAPAPVEVAPPAPVAPMAEAQARAADSIFYADPEKPAPVMRKVDLPAARPTPLMQVATVRAETPRAARPGRFVVQLGAFSSASRVEAAWDRYSARGMRLNGYMPVSTTFRAANRATVHRLSVGGFATRAEAATLCNQIRAKGGQCFVRGNAGDAPIRFASRAKAPKPTRLASN